MRLAALPAAAILRLPKKDPIVDLVGLTNWWRFKKDFVDSIGGKTGTPTNVASFPKIDGTEAMYLGGNGYVTLPSLRLGDSGAWSVSVWYRPEDTSGYSPLLVTTNSDLFEIAVAANSDPKPRVPYFYEKATASASRYSNRTLEVGTWVMITLTNDASGLAWYVNGVAAATAAASSTKRDILARVGMEFSGNKNHFCRGHMRDMMIYNKKLAQADVQNLYNALKAA